jgi:hypothetical protein
MADEPKETVQRHIARAVELERLAIEELRQAWRHLFDGRLEPTCPDTPILFPPVIKPKE